MRERALSIEAERGQRKARPSDVRYYARGRLRCATLASVVSLDDMDFSMPPRMLREPIVVPASNRTRRALDAPQTFMRTRHANYRESVKIVPASAPFVTLAVENVTDVQMFELLLSGLPNFLDCRGAYPESRD
jgi:hypothetical protein